MAILSKKTLYVGTDNGIFRSTDGGVSWTKTNTAIINKDIENLVFFRGDLYAVTSDGFVRSPDGGLSWLPINEGLVASDGGTGSKRPREPSITRWNGATLTVSEGKLYTAIIGGNDSRWNPPTSGIFCLARDGNSWLPIQTNMQSSNGRISSFSQLTISGKTFYVIGGTRLYRWEIGENLWTDLGSKNTHGGKLAVSGKTVYFARNDGKLLRSVDEGDTWTDVSQRLPNWDLQSKPNYRQVGYDLHFVGETIYLGSYYHLRSTDVGETNVDCGFYRVFRSTDGGETWRIVDGLPGGGVHDIKLVYGTTLYGANSNGIFRLTHGPDSWERIASPQRDVKSLAFDGTTFYISTSGEGVFRLSLDE